MMVYCTQCGRKMKAKECFCSGCGAARPATASVTQRVSSWKATLALILGIISVIAPWFSLVWSITMGLLGVIAGIMAIVFAVLSRQETNGRLSGMAFCSIILGIAGLCVSLIVLMFSLVYLLMQPFLPDLTDATEIYFWLYENFGENVAQVFEKFMFLWE